MNEIDEVFSEDWEKSAEENRKKNLDKYGEVFVYKNKIIPHELITNKIRLWFKDERFEFFERAGDRK